jgi:hypothetical protein
MRIVPTDGTVPSLPQAKRKGRNPEHVMDIEGAVLKGEARSIAGEAVVVPVGDALPTPEVCSVDD